MPTDICNIEKYLPATVQWFNKMLDNPEVRSAFQWCGFTEITFGEHENVKFNIDVISNQSLYIRDPKRNKPMKMETKQGDLKDIFERLVSVEISPNYVEPPHLSWKMNWDEMPCYVHPTFGNLPLSRLERKCDQLRNMAIAVSNIAHDGDVIVDFCSGGGHLGILLAHLLPNCIIIMIENKEESALRILNRIDALPNTSVYQSNVDYFQGEFNIGVALHACGTATDLVIQKCLGMKAAFVVCPCCYGSIRANSNVSYPRSKRFQTAGITSDEYCLVGHAADQTHENGHKNKQGKQCMGLVDTDRCTEAEELDYRCKLFSMEPTNCTLKNNVILGLPKGDIKNEYEWW